MLDLVLSNIPVNDLIATDPLSKIDRYHPPIQFSVPVKSIHFLPNNGTKRYRFYKADYDAIRNDLLQVEWLTELNCAESKVSINEIVDKFYEILRIAISKHVPFSSFRKTKKYPLWFTPELIRRLKEKYKIRVIFRKYKNPMDALSYELLKSRCDIFARNTYNAYIKNLEDSLSRNPKLFWSHVKNKRGNNVGTPVKLGTMITGQTRSKLSVLFTHLTSLPFTIQMDRLSRTQQCGMRLITVALLVT